MGGVGPHSVFLPVCTTHVGPREANAITWPVSLAAPLGALVLYPPSLLFPFVCLVYERSPSLDKGVDFERCFGCNPCVRDNKHPGVGFLDLPNACPMPPRFMKEDEVAVVGYKYFTTSCCKHDVFIVFGIAIAEGGGGRGGITPALKGVDEGRTKVGVQIERDHGALGGL